MNYAIFLSILNLILLARLRLTLRDDGINRKDVFIIGGIPLLAMPFFAFNLSWVLLLVYLLAYPPLMYWSERSAENLNRNRALFLLMHVVIIGLLSSSITNLTANALPEWGISVINGFFLPSGSISLEGIVIAQAFLFGFLMVLNEANIILRYLLKMLGLKSLGDQGKEVDEEEYSMGRIIGLLERIFVFLFVLLNQYAAIGFILAAKGVTRFKNFETRTFAEYVLIGTLLSTLLAMAVGFVLKLAV